MSVTRTGLSLSSVETKNVPLVSRIFSYPAVLRKLAPGLFLADAQTVTNAENYDAEFISEVDQTVEEISARLRQLDNKIVMLKRHYDDIEGYYSAKKLMLLADEIAQEIEDKHHAHTLLCKRPVMKKIEWKIVETKKVDSVIYQPLLLEKMSLKLDELQADMAVLSECKQLSNKLNPLLTIRAAAKKYCEVCNRALEEKIDKSKIDKYVLVGQLFSCASTITYDNRSNKFVCQPNLNKYSPRAIIDLFNLSVKGVSLDKETESAFWCINEEITKSECKDFYTFNRTKPTSALEVKPAYVLLEEKLENMKKKGYEVLKKYMPFSNKEKSIVDNFVHQADILKAIFDDLGMEFDNELLKLGIEKFKMAQKLEMQSLYEEFDAAGYELERKMKNSKVNCSTLFLFQAALDRIKLAQAALNKKVDTAKTAIQGKFLLIQQKFDGKAIPARLAQLLIDLDEIKNLSRDSLIKAEKIELDIKYRHAKKALEEKMAIMDVLQFVKEHILSADKLKNFWSHEVRALNLGCFFIGGSKIEFNDGTNVIVPDGIAHLYQKLNNITLTDIDTNGIVELYKEVKNCVDQRVNHNTGLTRKDATTRRFYDLLVLLPDSKSIKPVHVDSFKESVATIANKNKTALLTELHYMGGAAVARM